jgi:hypothetical protein
MKFNTSNNINIIKNNSGIYKITNMITGKIYIGSTIRSFYKRWYEHYHELNHCEHKNCFLQNDWNKYGKENFYFEIVEINKNKDLIPIEYKYIHKLNTLHPNGYNICGLSLEDMRYYNNLIKYEEIRSNISCFCPSCIHFNDDEKDSFYCDLLYDCVNNEYNCQYYYQGSNDNDMQYLYHSENIDEVIEKFINGKLLF